MKNVINNPKNSKNRKQQGTPRKIGKENIWMEQHRLAENTTRGQGPETNRKQPQVKTENDRKHQ